MIKERPITISFIYQGKTVTRNIYWMEISSYDIGPFYRIPGKRLNFDIYKKNGVWVNKIEPGLSPEVLELVGRAIDETEGK